MTAPDSSLHVPPAPAAPPGPPPEAGSQFDRDVLDKIVRLLSNIQDRASIVRACLEKLAIPPERVDAAIDAARTKLTRAADFHRDEEFGRAITRLNECYQRAIGIQDTKTAIAAQKELNWLLGLGPDGRVPPPDEEPPEISGERRKIESQALADLVAAVEQHLEPLGLSEDLADTDADLVRLAGEELRRLRGGKKSRNRKERKERKGRRTNGKRAATAGPPSKIRNK